MIANLTCAANTCFLVLLGDFDFHILAGVGKAKAYAWFWSYNVFVVWIMFNSVLAIIMDAYVDFKGHRPRRA